jgi:hypothetical protein
MLKFMVENQGTSPFLAAPLTETIKQIENPGAGICPSSSRDNHWRQTKGYLLHRIRINF